MAPAVPQVGPAARLRQVARRATTLAADHPVMAVFAVALLVRALVAAGIFVFSDGWLFGDDLRYSQLAAGKAEGPEAFAALSPYWGPETYTQALYDATEGLLGPITALYEVFGHWKLAGQLFVALAGAAAAAAVMRLTMEFLPGRWPLLPGLTVALLPSQILFSSLILKDALVWVSMATLALIAAVALRSAGLRLVLLGVAATGVLVYIGNLRWQTMIIAAWALGLASLVGMRRQRLPRVAGAVLIAALVPHFMSHGYGGIQSIKQRGDLGFARAANALNADTAIAPERGGATQVASPAGKEASGASQEPKEEPKTQEEIVKEQAEAGRERVRLMFGQEGGFEGNLKALPRGVSVVLLEPYPWQSSSSTSLDLAKLEDPIWYTLVLLGLLGLVSIRPRHLRAFAFPLLAGGASLLAFALSEGNIGTAFRHRGELVWVIAILATLGLSTLAARRAGQAGRGQPLSLREPRQGGEGAEPARKRARVLDRA